MTMIFNITKAGRAALLNNAQTGTVARTVVAAGVTASDFMANEDMTALPAEIKRISTVGGAVLESDLITLVINDTSADTYTVRAFGLYLDDGTLFGVYAQSSPLVEKTAISTLLLQADLRIIDASLDAQNITFGNQEFINPTATEKVEGIVRLATKSEAKALVLNGAVAVNPEALGVAIDGKIASASEIVERKACRLVDAAGLFGSIANKQEIKGGTSGRLIDAAGLFGTIATSQQVQNKEAGALLDAAGLPKAFKGVNSNPGYVELPNGLIFQWATLTLAAVGNYNAATIGDTKFYTHFYQLTLPRPFPSYSASVNVTIASPTMYNQSSMACNTVSANLSGSPSSFTVAVTTPTLGYVPTIHYQIIGF